MSLEEQKDSVVRGEFVRLVWSDERQGLQLVAEITMPSGYVHLVKHDDIEKFFISRFGVTQDFASYVRRRLLNDYKLVVFPIDGVIRTPLEYKGSEILI